MFTAKPCWNLHVSNRIVFSLPADELQKRYGSRQPSIFVINALINNTSPLLTRLFTQYIPFFYSLHWIYSYKCKSLFWWKSSVLYSQSLPNFQKWGYQTSLPCSPIWEPVVLAPPSRFCLLGFWESRSLPLLCRVLFSSLYNNLTAWKFLTFVVELNIWLAETKYVWWLVNEDIIFNRFHIKDYVIGFEDLETVCKSEPRKYQFTIHLHEFIK